MATSPAVPRPAASTAPIHSAAAASASRRAVIGVVPAWAAAPANVTDARVWPAIASTTPTGSSASSSTGPCSMWTSR